MLENKIMHPSLLVLALSGLLGIAHAQPAKPDPAAASKAGAGSAAQAAAAAKSMPLYNPYNGKLISAEQIQRELEQKRLETQMLEEQLKQTNLSEELKTVPLRKAVEAAQAATAVKKEEVNQKELEAVMKAPKVLPMPEVRADAKADAKAAASKKKPTTSQAKDGKDESSDKEAKDAKAKAAKDAKDSKEVKDSKDAKAAGSQPAPPPRPTLVSVVSVGNSRTAVLEYAGGTLVLADGAMSPLGPLQILDEGSVDLGGTMLRVHSSTMARFIASDPKPAAPSSGGSVPALAPSSVTAPAPTPPQGVNGAMQSTTPLPPLPLPPSTPAGGRAQLPALQLPPGVSVMPTR